MKKKGLKALNRRAKKLEKGEVFGMGDVDVLTGQPIGCTTIFDTGWETNPRPTTPMRNPPPRAVSLRRGCPSSATAIPLFGP